jgi:repressor LexA
VKGLTKRQLEILNFIETFIESNRFSPSFREITSHFGFSSVNTVTRHISALQRKGFLLSEPKCSRSLTLTEASMQKKIHPEIELPFIGTISAGYPIETFPHTQTVAIPEFMVHDPEKTYVLKAKGDSFQEEMIANGDLLLIEARETPLPGDTVAALINQHDTIVKRYFPEGPYVKLIGNNPHHHPIILRREDIVIQGVLVGLFRLYS